MNKAIKKKWVKALRSGEYAQCKGELAIAGKKYDTFCCLGVLCDVAGDHEDFMFWRERPPEGGAIIFSEYTEFRRLCGIDDEAESTLVKMNDDDGASFKKIATYIEKNL